MAGHSRQSWPKGSFPLPKARATPGSPPPAASPHRQNADQEKAPCQQAFPTWKEGPHRIVKSSLLSSMLPSGLQLRKENSVPCHSDPFPSCPGSDAPILGIYHSLSELRTRCPKFTGEKWGGEKAGCDTKYLYLQSSMGPFLAAYLFAGLFFQLHGQA